MGSIIIYVPNLSFSSFSHFSRRNSSIRYVGAPNKPRTPRTRTISLQSDYNDGRDRIVLTDMTMLPEEDEEDLRPPSGVERSQSTISRESQRPEWTSNMKGDYDITKVKPIATKDLICWAYQVKRLYFELPILQPLHCFHVIFFR